MWESLTFRENSRELELKPDLVTVFSAGSFNPFGDLNNAYLGFLLVG